jgi:hypothetical protein
VATYQGIQGWIKEHHGFAAQACWIADVKERRGLPTPMAPNRLTTNPAKPCPPDKVSAIDAALRHFGMV